MFRSHMNRIGPPVTPKSIKTYILLTGLLSLFCALQISFFPSFPLSHALALSKSGIAQGFYWQFFTYGLLIPSSGLQLGFLLESIFILYVIWVFGSSLVERTSPLKFFLTYFLSSLFSGASALFVMYLTDSNAYISGCTTLLYSYLIIWTMANPYAEIRLFFTIPFHAKYLILTLLGINILFSLIHFQFIHLAQDLTAALVGYVYGYILFRSHHHFTLFHKLEKFFLFFKRKPSPSKIVPMPPPIEPHLDDDKFMDAMLTKISLHGKDALTSKEKHRMQKISARKHQKE